MRKIRRMIAATTMSGLLALAFAAPSFAGHHTTVQKGGAAGLIAAVVQVAVTTDDINIANNSLNNLLRNADIDVLNNVLNNSLNNLTIDVDIIDESTLVVNVLSIGGVNIGDITVTPSL